MALTRVRECDVFRFNHDLNVFSIARTDVHVGVVLVAYPGLAIASDEEVVDAIFDTLRFVSVSRWQRVGVIQ